MQPPAALDLEVIILVLYARLARLCMSHDVAIELIKA